MNFNAFPQPGSATPTRQALILVAISACIQPSAAFAFAATGLHTKTPSSRSLFPHDVSVSSAHNAASRVSRCHGQRPRSRLPRAAEDDGVVDGGAEAGIGLDGDWEVESGEGSIVGSGIGLSADVIPGQMPETTVDGKDWAAWAREWRDDPEGKADRLVKQLESQASDRDAARGLLENAKPGGSKPKRKKKNATGPSRGFGGIGGRATKSVPKGLVVRETDADEKKDGGVESEGGVVVDWSTGQQLAESNRERDFAAQWQGEADRINSLSQGKRDELEVNIRQALGRYKSEKKNGSKKNASSSADNTAASRGFGEGKTGLTSGEEKLSSPEEKNAVGDDEALAVRAKSFGKGVSVVPDTTTSAVKSSSGEPSAERSEQSDALLRARSFGRGVSIRVEDATGGGGAEVVDGGGVDNRLRGFGRGVAIPEDTES